MKATSISKRLKTISFETKRLLTDLLYTTYSTLRHCFT
jgi:hypothetical protein